MIVTNVFDMIEAQPAPASTLPNMTTLPEALAAGAEFYLPDPSSGLNNSAMLQCTGCTTGHAKGAVLTDGGVIAGGAALVEEVASEWKRHTGSEIYEGYGLSETASSLTCNSEHNRQLGKVLTK